MSVYLHTHPGADWLPKEQHASYEPDRGGRGRVWVHGAFEPATGQASLVVSPHCRADAHRQLLEQILTDFPAERYLFIEDNLRVHKSRAIQLALAAWPQIQVLFLPKYACWLNLIEPWWKQLRSLALKGRRLETYAQVETLLVQALRYWNAHAHPYRWKKKPQEQSILLGGFSPALNSSPS